MYKRQAYCYDFIAEWLHSDNIQQLYDVARYVEDEARMYQRFEKLTVEDLVGTECFPCKMCIRDSFYPVADGM